MKVPIRSLTALGVALTAILPGTASAQSYQVDCAILLCLAGGWPASAPCAHARAVFIQRITPGQSSHRSKSGAVRWEWRSTALHRFLQWNGSTTSPSRPSRRSACRIPQFPLVPVQAGERADVDISGDEFDFVRSIRSITSSSASAKIVMAIASALTALALFPTAPKETITGHVRVWLRFLRHLTFLALGAADRSATDRSSSIGGTMPATTLRKKSDTEPSPGQRRVGLFL